MPDPMIAPWDSDDDASRTVLRLIAQSANDGIWDWSLETGRVFYSPRWLELIGCAPGAASGDIDTFLDRLHDDDRERVGAGIATYLEGRAQEYRMEFRLRHESGDWRWIMSRGVAVRNRQGRPVRFVGTHTDITERVRTEERLEREVQERTAELRAARDRAESATAAKMKFFAAASHDIRQPLQAMALLLGTLEPQVQSPPGRRTMKALQQSLGAGMDLLDALLEFIRLDAGAMRPRMTAVDLGGLVESVAEAHSAEAAGKGLDLRVARSTATVRSDPQLLARMIRNLVSNAVKYTDRGRILIGCRRRAGRVWLEVWDTGRGVAPERRNEIFWEFCRDPDDRGRPGLGLGLAIVERLADLLKHRVHMRSWPGRGSVFSIEMEAAATSPAAGSAPPAAAADRFLAGRRIVLIEDDPAVARALKETLSGWGARVITAPTGRLAGKRLRGRPPDLAIVDCELADREDGFDALSRLERLCGRRLPSLLLTGNYDVGELGQRNAERRRILHKPVWPAVLQAALRSELSFAGAGDDAAGRS